MASSAAPPRRPLLRAIAAGVTTVAALLALTALPSPAGAADTAVRAGTPGLPPAGKVALVLGQDSDTLSDYRRDVLGNASLGAPAPGAVTLYTNLVLGGSPAPLAGMTGPVDWGAGTVDFARTLREYPNSSLAVGLYLSDATSGCGNQPLRAIIGRPDADVTAGSPNLITRYRAEVDEMINRSKAYDRDVLLRIGLAGEHPPGPPGVELHRDRPGPPERLVPR
ncbi:hypothetical protein ACFCXG_37480 [Streptomyces sp. NPDC056295]|uniref:hypothetical protein n=1 Tax=Streptomyces sp. NPDC056295 TaxID=3345774 RepID=UPI0035DC4A66